MLEGIGRFAHARHGFCIVTLCQGHDSSGSFFAFVAVEPHNYNYFRKTYQPGSSGDFSPFGQELLRGAGITPSDDVIRYISGKHQIEFNVDRRFMERLIAITTHSANESPFPLKPAEALGSS